MADDADSIPFDPRVAGGDEIRKEFNYALTVNTDMHEEMSTDAKEVAITAIEKAAGNYEVAAKSMQDDLVKKYGPGWHVVMGEGFGMEISYDLGSLMYCFSAGQVGVLIWKCN